MRNRLTISCLAITIAQAFFNARLRQCPNSNSLLTAPLSNFAAVHIRSSGTPWDTHQILPAHHQRHPKPDDSRTALFPASATHHIGPATPPPAPFLDLQPGSGAGTAAGIYGLRRLKVRHCAEPAGEVRSALDFLQNLQVPLFITKGRITENLIDCVVGILYI